MTFFGAATTVLKKSQTIRHHRGGMPKSPEPMTPTVKMADLVGHSKHIKDEE